MSRFETAAVIINDAAAEIGLVPVSDPYAETDPAFVQLRNILGTAGRELWSLNYWQRFVKSYQITIGTTVQNPLLSGFYDLPADFGDFIDQTGWSPVTGGSGMPLGGPLSEQDWSYLVNTNLASSTIYVSFKISQGQFQILPNPGPTGVILNFNYQSRYWVAVTAAPTVPVKDKPTLSTDVILFEPILMVKFLKLRYLEAKGFDTTAAVAQFLNMMSSWTGNDKAAQILNTARSRIFPYLGWRNIPETNYGLP